MRIVLPILILLAACAKLPQEDPLPSWNEGPAKQAILDYLARVTTKGGEDFVAPQDRIATFDNDGTLWTEKPTYFQVLFALERIKAMAGDHPEWKETQPFKTVLDGDKAALSRMEVPELLKLVMATHSGMTEAEFEATAKSWLKTARHPRFSRPYTELIYQPMLELMELLRAHGFAVWICTGGTQGFVRTFSQRVYDVPADQVVGTVLLSKFEQRDGKWVLVRTSELVKPVNDRPGKPVGIQRHIGKRPIVAVGNSDGDIEMLQWARAPALRILVHHDDEEREYSYTHGTERALEVAEAEKWTVVRIKQDFKTIYPEATR